MTRQATIASDGYASQTEELKGAQGELIGENVQVCIPGRGVEYFKLILALVYRS